ncbi:MAG: class D beta-lactamase [Pseudomonadales bacterium]
MRVLISYLFLFYTAQALAAQWQERDDWAALFAERAVTGTIAVADERVGRLWVHDRERAGVRFVPASTFKIPHTLFALDAGVARDEFQVFRWDGVARDVPAWNRDQTLRSALRNSVVWVYQGFARAIGEDDERHYLQLIDYGNADPSGGIDRFWLDGALRISAFEQLTLLQRLYRNQLPFHVEQQRLVKDLMIVEAGRDWILRAKSGWSSSVEPEVGWWVGWIEWPEGPVFFALNMEMRNGASDLPQREGVARQVLRSIQALPAQSE